MSNQLVLSLGIEDDSYEDPNSMEGHDGTSRNDGKTNSENQAHNNQNSVSNESVPVPKKRKFWFFLSYSSFLIFYLVFVVALAYTYPLKPVCKVNNFQVPANITMNSSVSVWFNFINRNPLISYSYGDIFVNVTVSYYNKSGDVLEINFATTKAQGFNQSNRDHKEVEVHMNVTGSVLYPLLQMYNETDRAYFQVNLDFVVTFDCSVSCRHKTLHMTPSIWYQYEINKTGVEYKDILLS